MDDGELDFSNRDIFPDTADVFSCSNLGERSVDSFLDEILRDTHACTHTHTCNPPGPDSSHTHTCFHVHTKILPPPSADDKVSTDESTGNKTTKKRSLGNREAVRKYREKKKARAASLEDEVVRLRALNQQLLKRLQGQAALEAELARLKCLLVDIRGRIEGEIGAFPYQKAESLANLPAGSYIVNPCNMQCSDQVYCLHPGTQGKDRLVDGDGAIIDGQGYRSCDFENVQCLAHQNNLGMKELRGCGLGKAASQPLSSAGDERDG